MIKINPATDRLLAGNTYNFTSEFYNKADQLADPARVVFIIFDSTFKQIGEASAIRSQTGKYYADHAFTNPGTFYCQFLGNLDGKPSLNTVRVTVVNCR